MFRSWYGFATHLIATGATGMGKSSWSEACRRNRLKGNDGYLSIMSGKGVFGRHWDYLRYMNPRKRVIGINLSDPENVTACNWISNLQGEEIGAHSSRIANAIAGAWGVKNLAEMQSYAIVAGGVVRWCAETGEPVQRAVEWLAFGATELQRKAFTMAKSDQVKRQISQIIAMTRFAEWNNRVGSTWNRLNEFVNSLALRRFTSLPDAIDIPAEVKAGSVVAVDLTPNSNLSWDAISVFASLLVSELLRAEGRFFIDLDECEHYLSFDAVRLLDTGRAKGLRFSLICHSESQFQDERIRASLDTNCGIRITFGGQGYWDRRRQTPELFAADLNARKIKETYYGYEQVLQPFENVTQYPDGESVLTGFRFEPGRRNMVTGRAEYSLEEKTSMAAERLATPRGIYHVKLPTGTQKRTVPCIRHFLPNDRQIVEFERAQPRPVSGAEADRLENESRPKFNGDDHEPPAPDRRKGPRKPRPLSPQH
jgi:hypothetical protein